MYKIKNYIFFAGYLLLNPRLIKLAIFHKIYLPVYVQFEWLKKYKIGTIIDVGANQGKVSQAIKFLFPESLVYAFEPNPKFYPTIRKVIKDSLTLAPFALSIENSKTIFYNYANPSMSSLLPLIKSDAQNYSSKRVKTTVVKTVTLDSYFRNKKLKKNIFLKIDTQGAEELILKGGKNILKSILVIHIETFFDPLYKKQTLFENIYEFLTKRGFKYAGEAPEAYFYPKFGPSSITNSVFINSKLNI